MTRPDLLRGARWEWLDHPLLGRHRIVNAIGIGYCVFVVAMILVVVGMYAGGVDLVPRWLILFLDGLSAVLFAIAVVSAAVLPIVYGLANGGPVLAAAIGLTPYVTASLLSLEFTLTNDLVVALVGAAVGATAAVASGWYVKAKATSVLTPGSEDIDGLFVASGITGVSLVAVWRFDQQAPAEIIATIDPAHWVILIPTIGCIGLWLLFAMLLR